MNSDFVSDRDLRDKAKMLRRRILDFAMRSNAGHVAPSLSCADILVALYYRIMRLGNGIEQDDRFILSKAHGCYGLYLILADIGLLPESEIDNFGKGGHLKGCAERHVKWGIEAGTGSLGHGLPMAVGFAWGMKMLGSKARVFCLVGDGELQEGSNWEALQVAAFYKLDNLFIIVDGNRLQAMDCLDNVLSYDSSKHEIIRKLEAFGCNTISSEGNDAVIFSNDIATCSAVKGKPIAIYAETTKGYGLLAMENQPKFHYRLPTQDEIQMGWRDE